MFVLFNDQKKAKYREKKCCFPLCESNYSKQITGTITATKNVGEWSV